MGMGVMSLRRRVAAARRVSRERACLLRSQGLSSSTWFLEARFRWRASGRFSGADAEVPYVCCCLCRVCDGGGSIGFNCGVFADGDDGFVFNIAVLSGG